MVKDLSAKIIVVDLKSSAICIIMHFVKTCRNKVCLEQKTLFFLLCLPQLAHDLSEIWSALGKIIDFSLKFNLVIYTGLTKVCYSLAHNYKIVVENTIVLKLCMHCLAKSKGKSLFFSSLLHML